MKKVYVFLLLLIFAFTSSAQSPNDSIFKKTIEKIKRLKSVTYTLNSVQKNPFSSDTSYHQTLAAVSFDSTGSVIYKLENQNSRDGRLMSRSIYGDQKLVRMDLIDSTYNVTTPTAAACDLTKMSKVVETELLKNSKKVFRKQDTLFQGKMCYSFQSKGHDTIVNGQHDFIHINILISKKELLPIYFKEVGEGSASKGGYSLGRVRVYEERIFSNVKFNPKITPVAFVPNGFSLPASEMLKPGEEAPELKITSLSGEAIEAANFHDKVLLVVFGATTCAANPLANPVLNRLQTKLTDPNFAILNIFTNDTREQVQKYVDANNLKFPVYLASRKLHSNFQIISSPDFYVIGKDGKIKTAKNGYSDDLENHLVSIIEAQLGKL